MSPYKHDKNSCSKFAQELVGLHVTLDWDLDGISSSKFLTKSKVINNQDVVTPNVGDEGTIEIIDVPYPGRRETSRGVALSILNGKRSA